MHSHRKEEDRGAHRNVSQKATDGSEQESVELPNWRALGVAAAPATDAEPSARSVARGQTVDKAKYPLLPEAYRRFCCHARGRVPHCRPSWNQQLGNDASSCFDE